ncbi:MAG: transporter substrate-binding protein, partial [Thermodesulfobacteriota bacterium]|nr:transporter substrate-binding protein [Thermodesulfobacteriota bacterium]
MRREGKLLINTFLIFLSFQFFLNECVSGQTLKGQEDKVIIGLNVPLTGSYSDQGKDEEMAYKLAIEQINAKGGVLGKKIEYILKDTKTDAAIAKQNAINLIRQNNAVLITGGSSSAEAVAQGDVCQELGVIFMAALTHSNATTGHDKLKSGQELQKAHRHTFRWYFNAWMTAKALAPYLVGQIKKNATFFYITSDYTWGHSLEESMKWRTELAGCDTIGTIRVPLGTKDYKKELAAAQKENPDVLVMSLFGQDMVAALKQASQMGLKKKTQIVVPLMELNMAHGAGIEAMEGILSTVNWYWDMGKRFPGTKQFVDAFYAKYKKMPGGAAACAWVAIYEWAAAVEKAGSFESAKVIKALEGRKFTLLKDQEEWREWDHQAISSVFIVQGKTKSESKGAWDLLKIVGEK